MKKILKTGGLLSRILYSKLFTLILLLVIVLGAFVLLTGGSYFKIRNIKNIMSSIAVVAFFAIGAGMLLVSGNLDLSTGAVGTLAGIVLALMLANGFAWPVALILALVLAGLIGLLNAVFIIRFRLQGFITTMAMASILTGATYIISSAKSIPIKNPVIEYIGTHMIGEILPVSVLIAVVFFVVYGVILSKTRFGLKIYMVGGNPQAAWLTGLDPSRIMYILFINNAVLGGIAGCVMAARMKSGLVDGTSKNQFSGLTAAILGGISFGGGEGGLLGAFVGLLILNSFNNGMSIVGLSSYWQTVASGALLLVALAFDFALQKGRMRRKS